jgi:hypothetical protein
MAMEPAMQFVRPGQATGFILSEIKPIAFFILTETGIAGGRRLPVFSGKQRQRENLVYLECKNQMGGQKTFNYRKLANIYN